MEHNLHPTSVLLANTGVHQQTALALPSDIPALNLLTPLSNQHQKGGVMKKYMSKSPWLHVPKKTLIDGSIPRNEILSPYKTPN
jgi:hypothetical protein